MSQYQNLPISTSTSTEKNIQYSTRPVPVQPKYWQYHYSKYWSNLIAKFEIFERKIGFHAGNWNLDEQFWIFKFEIEIWKEKSGIFWKTLRLPIYLLDFCCFVCFGTGTDWLSTCTASTSTESVLENWTSTSISVPKMISRLKKSVPVSVDWLIYSF